ncbi:MAG: helix-turn-helix domain-containing protein [Halioglobus sp.]
MNPVLATHQHFSSVSEFSDTVSQLGWLTHFRQLDCGTGATSLSALLNSTAILLRVCCDRRTKQDVVPPQGYQTIGLPLSSLKSSTIQNRPLNNGQLLYVHEQEGFSCVGDPGFDAYTVSIASSRMSELSQNLHLSDPGDTIDLWGTEIRPDPKRLATVKAIVHKIFDLEQSPPQDLVARSTLDELIEAQLPSALLQIGTSQHSGNRVPIRNRELALQRAINYVENHSKEALTVEALCLGAATSLSTLERAFRERFSISPKRYIVVQRLNHVHAALLDNHERRTISDVASEWGFWHMGQFAADYKLLFGYLPSKTSVN